VLIISKTNGHDSFSKSTKICDAVAADCCKLCVKRGKHC